MVTKVIGKVDGQEVIYERAEGDLWNVTVPLDLDGMYVIEVTAYDEAGNITFCTKMLLIVDPETLCVRLQPYDYMVDIIQDGYGVSLIPDQYRVDTLTDEYKVTAQCEECLLEVVYPEHGRGCCCE